jgi:hypothetical protein
MSRKLDRERSEANALRTLDERRAAQAAQERNKAARSAPGGSYANDRRAPPPQGNGYGYGYGQAPAPAQPPVVVQRDGGGLGHIVAGAILARSMSNAHANNNNNNGANNNGGNGSNGSNGGYYPAPSGSAGDLANQAGAGSVGAGTAADSAPAAAGQAKSVGHARAGSVLGTIFWLFVLALVAWGIWFFLKRRKARREADKPNYSFERN